ncbi:MAG: hypothetical protein EAZ98_01000 [Oscillatoriales cyanobacterium]|nr:MAG: hypothetical protein EA000_08670 [Oscillatoriales cyanobacterium]TAE02819.1 MAG: hypothetical protein EAZ98_01000 [Oscillatoriales cyanobacterium]TAF36778.1 MAG: hypothetical protein EAZ68_15935 [Oscillatoriales cyanobacterium]TAF61447.1 MAG: hypothetical protein EAZ59_25510 [Oscillatoriales cyanobacterium]
MSRYFMKLVLHQISQLPSKIYNQTANVPVFSKRTANYFYFTKGDKLRQKTVKNKWSSEV